MGARKSFTSGAVRGVVGWERVSTPFCTNFIKTWLRSHRYASDTQIRTAN